MSRFRGLCIVAIVMFPICGHLPKVQGQCAGGCWVWGATWDGENAFAWTTPVCIGYAMNRGQGDPNCPGLGGSTGAGCSNSGSTQVTPVTGGYSCCGTGTPSNLAQLSNNGVSTTWTLTSKNLKCNGD
jgi:hypothetical protein